MHAAGVEPLPQDILGTKVTYGQVQSDKYLKENNIQALLNKKSRLFSRELGGYKRGNIVVHWSYCYVPLTSYCPQSEAR